MLTITRWHEAFNKTSMQEDNLAEATLQANTKTLRTMDGFIHAIRANVAATVRSLRLRRECGG